MAAGLLERNVFINCPFDEAYEPIFRATIFTVHYLGFFPRCALEGADSSVVRLDKIMSIIVECPFGIHDISAVELSPGHGLPRFNMPLELGLFLGCKRFGGVRQRQKSCLILDREPYRYQVSISDIAGQDIRSHQGKPEAAIVAIRNWLVTASTSKGLPGGEQVVARYAAFSSDLPRACQKLRRNPKHLTYSDFSEMVEAWLKNSR